MGANFGLNQTENGWMKGDAFFYYVTEHLNPRWIQMNAVRPLVLCIDGYSGHHSYKLFKWCQDNQVILIVLYPNSTHLLQMCDIAMFGPLKQKYLEVFQNWKSENPEKFYDEVEFVKLLKKANDASIKKESIVNGWRASGLQPFNFNNVMFDRLVGVSHQLSPKVRILADERVNYDLTNVWPDQILPPFEDVPEISYGKQNSVEEWQPLDEDSGFEGNQ